MSWAARLLIVVARKHPENDDKPGQIDAPIEFDGLLEVFSLRAHLRLRLGAFAVLLPLVFPASFPILLKSTYQN